VLQKPFPACRTPQCGLTLLEVVVATAIFSVTVVSLLIVRDRAIEQTAVAKNYRIARRLAMQILEEIHGGKEYEADQGEAFDQEKYPGFSWRMSEVETVEFEEPEDDPFKDPNSGNAKKKKPAGPGGGLLGGGGGFLAALGQAEELKRYVLEITYPARTDEGSKAIEVVTYYLKEADGDALAKAMAKDPAGAAAAGMVGPDSGDPATGAGGLPPGGDR